jgi:hypothetical protein
MGYGVKSCNTAMEGQCMIALPHHLPWVAAASLLSIPSHPLHRIQMHPDITTGTPNGLKVS